MQNIIPITEDLYYVGGSDRRLSLFENVYPVPRGVSYNSYLLLDEKTVLFDTVDPSVSDLYLENVAAALGGRQLDYLVVHHMEPDHSATFLRLVKSYPEAVIVTSAKAAQMMKNFFPFDGGNVRIVKEGDVLSTGKHSFTFVAVRGSGRQYLCRRGKFQRGISLRRPQILFQHRGQIRYSGAKRAQKGGGA